MKPKYHRRIRHAFPSLIVVPAILQLATAATFEPDTAGNILVPGNFSSINGQNFTIIADGGAGTSFTAIIENGVIFTSDAVLQDAMQVSVSGYTITNNGSLTGTDDGISSTVDITLENFGTIEGLASEGIITTGGFTSITNNAGGIIRGADDAVFFSTNEGQVINFGQIFGVNGSSGVSGQSSFQVVNFGLIDAESVGILGDQAIQVRNYKDITSGTHGVALGFQSSYQNITSYDMAGDITDFGSITGTTTGVILGADSIILNNIAGLISGGVNGATVGTDSEVYNYGAIIQGNSGVGLTAGDDVYVVNRPQSSNGTDYAARIWGETFGIFSGQSLVLENEGSILAFGGIGVSMGDNLNPFVYNITNRGTITGELGGVTAGDDVRIYNNGGISATFGNGILAGEGLTLLNDDSGQISSDYGVFTTGGGASIDNRGRITALAAVHVALSLGDTAGVGNNSISLSSNGEVYGDIVASGTGNSLTSASGVVFGDISGIQEMDVTSGGNLQIVGDILTPTTMTVDTSGQITGIGSWLAGIDLAPDSRIFAEDPNGPTYTGIIDIDGNVNHQSGSFIRTVISAYDTIDNNGTTATLLQSSGGVYNAADAILSLDLGGPLGALRNGDYVIVEQTGGIIVGGGNEIWFYNNPNSVLGTYFATSGNFTGDLVVTVDHDFSSLPGLSKNGQSVGAALDEFMEAESGLPSGGSNDDDLRYVVAILDAGDLAPAQDIISGFAAPAEAALALTQSVVNSNYRINRLVQDHNAAVRSTGGIVSVPVGMSAKDAPAAPATYSRKGNVWGAVSYDWQDYEGDGDVSDFDAESASFTAGVDYLVAPDLVLGFLLDGSKADIDGSGSSTDIDSFRATAYGTWGASTGLYSDFLIGYGSHDNDFTDASSVQALATIGYAMGDQRVKHGPYAGLEYQNVDVDSFDADSFLPLEVDGYEIDSFRALIGYRVNATLGRFKPYASISYAHEFEDGKSSTDTSMGPVSFKVEGGDQGSAILLTAGTGISITSALTLDLGYRGEVCVDSEGMDSHGGNVGLNWNF